MVDPLTSLHSVGVEKMHPKSKSTLYLKRMPELDYDFGCFFKSITQGCYFLSHRHEIIPLWGRKHEHTQKTRKGASKILFAFIFIKVTNFLTMYVCKEDQATWIESTIPKDRLLQKNISSYRRLFLAPKPTLTALIPQSRLNGPSTLFFSLLFSSKPKEKKGRKLD